MAKKKELAWNVPVGGRVYHVQCVDNGNKYDLYLDDEHLTRVWKQDDIRQDREQDVTIGGKVCQFVVYDGIPDLAVDGILLNAEAEFQKTEKSRRRFALFTGIFQTLIGILACFCWAILTIGGGEVPGGWFTLVLVIGFTALGLWQILRERKRKEC